MNSPRRIELSRRTVLRIGGATAASVALSNLLAACSFDDGGSSSHSNDGESSNDSNKASSDGVLRSEAPLPEAFRAHLPIPPVLEPIRRDDTTDYYEITQKVGHAAILTGLTTELWGYNGILPGPTIVSRRGRRTVVTHRNELPVPVSVHLHGGVTAPWSGG